MIYFFTNIGLDDPSGQRCCLGNFSNSLYFVLKVLAEEGFIKGFLVKKDKDSLETKKLHVLLKYKHDKSIIDNIVRQPKNIVFLLAGIRRQAFSNQKL